MQKSILYIVLLSFLLQSCFSYKTVDKNSEFVMGKKYNIKQANKYEKVRLLSSTDSTITVNNAKKTENTIAKNDIKKIKKRHFSIIKTALLPVGIAVGGVVIIVAFGGGYKLELGKLDLFSNKKQ